MSELVMDTKVINDTLNEINRVMRESRKQLDEILLRNNESDSYEELKGTKDLMKLYGNCADDYAKLSYLQTGVSEAMMDLRSVRRQLTRESSTIAPSLVKTYRSRIDLMIEELKEFRDAIHASRQGMEARVRYFNSCAYTNYERVIGAKC